MARLEVVDPRLRHDAPAVEHRDPVADALHVREDVGREEDRGAAREGGDHVEHLLAPERIERAGGLVEQQEARGADQRLGDAEALLHAPRVAA